VVVKFQLFFDFCRENFPFTKRTFEAPNYLHSKFTTRSNVSSYSLRDTNGKLAIPLPHTNLMKDGFSYSGAFLWNSLPVELCQANSLGAFRAGYKQFF